MFTAVKWLYCIFEHIQRSDQPVGFIKPSLVYYIRWWTLCDQTRLLFYIFGMMQVYFSSYFHQSTIGVAERYLKVLLTSFTVLLYTVTDCTFTPQKLNSVVLLAASCPCLTHYSVKKYLGVSSVSDLVLKRLFSLWPFWADTLHTNENPLKYLRSKLNLLVKEQLPLCSTLKPLLMLWLHGIIKVETLFLNTS